MMAQEKKKGQEEIKGEVESILFASAKWVSLSELQKLCGADSSQIERALKDLAKEYDEKGSSIALVEEDRAFKLVVRDKYLPLVENVVTETELPKSVLETLAVIAFKHPIHQADVVKIRSNKAYDHLTELENRGFIKREKYGRTKKIHLTQKFFDYFDLPPNKVKEAFASYEAVSQEIEKKEMQLSDMQEEREGSDSQNKTQHLGVLEVYDVQPAEEKPSVTRYKENEELNGMTVVQMLDEELDNRDEEENREDESAEEDADDDDDEDEGELEDESDEGDEPDEDSSEDEDEGSNEEEGSEEEEPSEEDQDTQDEDEQASPGDQEESPDTTQDDEGESTGTDESDEDENSSFDPFSESDEDDTDGEEPADGDEDTDQTDEETDDEESTGDSDEEGGKSGGDSEEGGFDEDSATEVFEQGEEGEQKKGDPFREEEPNFEPQNESEKQEYEIAQKLSKKVNSIFSGESEEESEKPRDKQFDAISKDLEKNKEELDR